MDPIRTRNLARLVPESALATAAFEKQFQPAIANKPPLPAVNWNAIGKQPPGLVTTPAADLPAADAIVIAWTDPEWAALHHVFCNAGTAMTYASRTRSSWTGWKKYSKDLPTIKEWNYWGEYRLVQMNGANVLLFKSNTHLDFPGKTYLAQLISTLIAAVKPKLIISTGTAGGARPGDHVGTVNVVRAATLYEASQPQSSWPDYSSNWSANWSVIGNQGFNKVLFPVPTTTADLQSICTQFNSFYKVNYALTDLNPANVNLADSVPAINDLTGAGTPLLTTDSFVVGTTSGNLGSFACVEMDDAIIAQICSASSVPFGSVRNISDPVQNATLVPKMQAHWGQAIYDAYGFYTSYNGAIAACAILDVNFA